MSSTFCPISQAPWRQQKFSSATAGLLLCLTLGDVQALEMTIGNQLVEHRVAPVGLDALHSAYVARLGLYEPAQEELIREKFQKRMLAEKHGVKTGFHGTGNLLQGLSAIGLTSDAGKTILNETPPSWGGMVKLGATTVWERWEGKYADGTFYSSKMNSFNHYTFGGCGEWMMGYLVGLREESPGFKIVRVEPAIIPDLTWAAGSFESPYGTVSNRWELKNGRIAMHLVIPPNSTARVILPAEAKSATLQGKLVPTSPVIGRPTVLLASGTHVFAWTD